MPKITDEQGDDVYICAECGANLSRGNHEPGCVYDTASLDWSQRRSIDEEQ